MLCSACNRRETKKKSESRAGIKPMTSRTPVRSGALTTELLEDSVVSKFIVPAYCKNQQCPINKLTSVFYASVLLLMINFVITLSKCCRFTSRTFSVLLTYFTLLFNKLSLCPYMARKPSISVILHDRYPAIYVNDDIWKCTADFLSLLVWRPF